MSVLFFTQAEGRVADVAGDLLQGDLLASRLGFLLLQPEHAAQRMGAGPGKGTAASAVPFASHRAGGALQALFTLHEQDLALLCPEDLRRLLHRRRVDKVLRVHELLPGLLDDLLQLVHLLEAGAVHLSLRHGLSDVLLALLSEISREGLFADHVLSRLHGFDGKGDMQERRKDDIDHVDLRVLQQDLIVGAGVLITVTLLHLLREIDLHVADSLQTDRHTVHLLISVSVEMCRVSRADSTDDNSLHVLHAVHVISSLRHSCPLYLCFAGFRPGRLFFCF